MLQTAQRNPVGKRLKRLPVNKEERTPPTPETATKLRPYHIASLPQDLQEAAGAIELAWRLLTGPLMLKPASVEHASHGRRAEYTRPQLLILARYKRWARELPRRRLELDWVITMVVDGMEPRELDWRTHHEPPWSAERLIEALALYNRMLGEVTIDNIPEND